MPKHLHEEAQRSQAPIVRLDGPARKQGRLRAWIRAVQGGHRADANWRLASDRILCVGGVPNLHRSLASARDEFSRRVIPHAGIRLQVLGGVASARNAARPYRGVARVKGRKVCPLMEVRIFANRAPTRSRQSLNPTNRRCALLAELRPSSAHEIVDGTRLLRTQVEEALAELVAFGVVTSDSFAGLRALLTPSEKRKPFGARRAHRRAMFGIEDAGRWALLKRREAPAGSTSGYVEYDQPTLDSIAMARRSPRLSAAIFSGSSASKAATSQRRRQC